MKSEAQALFDSSLLSTLPVKAVPMNMAPVSNKEAQALFEIWNSKKDQNGNPIVPEGVNENLLMGLARRGILELTYGLEPKTFRQVHTVRLGSVAEKVIKNIILAAETSQFENKQAALDYELIHRAALMGNLGKQADGKTAAVNQQSEDRTSNWFSRLDDESSLNCDN